MLQNSYCGHLVLFGTVQADSIGGLLLALPTKTAVVVRATSGADAVGLARQCRFDCVVFDGTLTDMSTVEVITRLRSEGIDVPCVVLSRLAVAPLSNVRSLPQVGHRHGLDLAAPSSGLGALVLPNASAWPRLPLSASLPASGSVAQKGAVIALKACDATSDIHTIGHWASSVGVSTSQLRDVYARLRVSPRTARDFTRMLRALTKAQGVSSDAATELNVGDYRTEVALLRRAGLDVNAPRVVGPEEFIHNQTFLPHGHSMAREIQSLWRTLAGGS